MDDFKDSEIAAMSKLQDDILDLMKQAFEGGMAKEHAVHVVGNVALTCMKKVPHTDDGSAVLQNFVMQVGELLGEPETNTRH